MANTRYLLEVEDYARRRLAQKYRQPFTKQFLRLKTGGRHEFDGVSADGKIVAGVKACLRLNTGQVRSAITEMYYLGLVDAPSKLLVLTSRPFFEAFRRKVEGAIMPGIEIECVDLPPEMQSEVERVIAEASREVSPIQAAVEQAEAELT